MTTNHIKIALQQLAAREGVRILFAIESGSRAWGFASRDSDFDVRFIFVRDCAAYLRLDPPGDVIDRTLHVTGADDNTPLKLDLVGWDLRKALHLVRKSNPSLMEWIKSPVVYAVDSAFALVLGTLAQEFYTPARIFQSYLGMARSHFETDREGIMPLKRTLYALRAVLACRWIEQGRGPVPVPFRKLVDTVVTDPLLRVQIAVLVARKRADSEQSQGQRIPAIDTFIANEIERLGTLVFPAGLTADLESAEGVLQAFCHPLAA